jgi:DNA-directed RNA polymerase specialized sigma24 family protein
MIEGDEVEQQDFSIVQLQQGEPDAFKVLFFQYYPEFLSFSILFLQDRAAAVIITFEAFFMLWERRAEFDSEKKIKAFLYLAVRNKCLHYMNGLSTAARSGERVSGEHVSGERVPAGIPSSLPRDILQDIFAYAAKDR